MITTGEGWHYLAVKKLSALLIGITSKNKSDFYCLNCIHFFRTKNKHESSVKETWGKCENKGKHIPSGFWMSTILLFKSIKNKQAWC